VVGMEVVKRRRFPNLEGRRQEAKTRPQTCYNQTVNNDRAKCRKY